MEYEKEELLKINIHSLRTIGREIGVRAPTVLTKNTLIDEILKIQSGKKEPCLPNKRGRPIGKSIAEIQVISNSNERAKILKTKEQAKRELISDILTEIEKKLYKLL